MRFNRAAVLAATLTVILSASASVAGFWNSSWPIVSGASYCAGSSTAGVPGTTPVCNVTVPAGPTALTGSELIPADTGLASGQQPQSVLIKPASIGAGPTQYSTPLTGTSITIAPTTRQVIVNPAGTIAALTIVTPAAASLVEGQRIGFCTTQIITALTVTAGTGVTVSNAPTAMLVPVATGAASCVEWVYVASAATLFRVQ